MYHYWRLLVLNEVLNIIRWIISPARPQYLAIVRNINTVLACIHPLGVLYEQPYCLIVVH